MKKRAFIGAPKAAVGWGRCGASTESVPCGDCAALLGLAGPSPNSLRVLRTLRSNTRDESVHDAR